MSVVSLELLTILGTLLLSLLIAVAAVTLTRSVVSARKTARHEAIRPRLRQEMLRRLISDEPAWAAWVEELGPTERTVVTNELEAYLQKLRGPERRTLQGLGRALGLDRRIRRQLVHGDHFERRAALTRVVRLDVAVSLATLKRAATGSSETRAGAARVLATREYPTAGEDGTEILLADQTEPLSVLGLDTLYQLNKHDATRLFDYAADSYRQWSESLMIQVLRVIREAGPTQPDASLSWVGFLFVSDSERVRVAAAEALEGYGWHDAVRAAVDIEQIRNDGTPEVRRAVYRMLGAWNDHQARQVLVESIRMETDPRTAIAGIRALDDPSALDDGFLTAESEAAQSWVRASQPVGHVPR